MLRVQDSSHQHTRVAYLTPFVLFVFGFVKLANSCVTIVLGILLDLFGGFIGANWCFSLDFFKYSVSFLPCSNVLRLSNHDL